MSSETVFQILFFNTSVLQKYISIHIYHLYLILSIIEIGSTKCLEENSPLPFQELYRIPLLLFTSVSSDLIPLGGLFPVLLVQSFRQAASFGDGGWAGWSGVWGCFLRQVFWMVVNFKWFVQVVSLIVVDS